MVLFLQKKNCFLLPVTEIGFYHLTRTDLAPAIARLLGRTLGLGERAVVVCPGRAEVAALDAALWLCAEPDWLPHGTAATPHPEWQPIYITEDEAENPAGAKFLFRTGGAAADAARYQRVFDLFDGNDEDQVAAARGRWRDAKAAGHVLTYWKQGAAGWEKSA